MWSYPARWLNSNSLLNAAADETFKANRLLASDPIDGSALVDSDKFPAETQSVENCFEIARIVELEKGLIGLAVVSLKVASDGRRQLSEPVESDGLRCTGPEEKGEPSLLRC
jgi:hypothetical protein